MNNQIPHIGQNVVVRNRPGIVKDIKKFESPADGVVNGIWIDYIDGYQNPERDFVIWERELNTSVFKSSSLPDISTINSPDEYSYFKAFVNSYRWTSNNLSQDLSTENNKNPRLISPWQSSIKVEGYQLYPLLKAMKMPRITLLLADDVGLGKTIEAGLILNELIARGRLRRCLIVCPAALQIQWRDEMAEKFYLDFQVVDRDTTFKLQKEYGLDTNPWSFYPRIVTSFDYLRQKDILENFNATTKMMIKENDAVVPWDMLVIDEAHNISSRFIGKNTERLNLIKSINPFFENRLFLTATPHNGYTDAFTGLLELLNPLVFDQKYRLEIKDHNFIQNYVVRRLKSELSKNSLIKRFSYRYIKRIDENYKLYDIEKQLFAALKEYKKQALKLVSNHNNKNRMIVVFLLSLLTKRLLSSSFAFANTWWNHFAGIKSSEIDASELEYVYDRAITDLSDDTEKGKREEEIAKKTGSWLSKNYEKLKPEILRINELLEQIGWTNEIVQNDNSLYNHLPKDSKWDSLFKWINEKLKNESGFRQDERVIVFTEYKHTLDYLLSRFNSIDIKEPKLEILHGRSERGEREKIKEAFNDHESPLKIMLVTDVASEGVNLQNNCRFVIHYDIPWNPMRMEQRNGRVDRFGQSRDVYVYNFISDEEEDLIFLEKVVNKVNQIREDLGSVGEIFDKGLEDHFFGDSIDKKRAVQYVQSIQPEAVHNNDLEYFAKGSEEEYKEALIRLQHTELELNITENNLAELLRIAFSLEKGKLTKIDEEGVYLIEVIPPKWKSLIESTLTIQTGRNKGALCKIVFNSSYFEKVENDRYVYLTKPDTRLVRLNHPIMKRAIGLLKRKLWISDSSDELISRLNRFTVVTSDIPVGLDLVIVIYLLIEASNDLREMIHEEVISIPLVVSKNSIEILDARIWDKININERQNLQPAQLKKIYPLLQENWINIEDQLKEKIGSYRDSQKALLEESLNKMCGEGSLKAKKNYEERLSELKSQKDSRYIKRIKSDIDLLKKELSESSLFEEINKQKIDDLKSLEINLEKFVNENIAYLENVLTNEKDRFLNRVLPMRYKLKNYDIHSIGIEYLVNKSMLK